jgi:hypothetical protein
LNLPSSFYEVVAAIAVLAAVVLVVRGWMRGLRARARSARAYAGERDAARILRAHGFSIVGAQVAAEYPVEVDGEIVVCGVRADYVVQKRGARFVAEVKTGTYAPRIATASTRRQLLEYGIAFDVDGVLLVDAERDVIHTVSFPRLQAAGKNGG